jgi:hypothetical protein
MKLRLFLKNSIKSALPLFSLLAFIFLAGCSGKIEPTYKEKDIPDIIKKICKEEYSLNVTTQRTKTTLWIYAPMDKLLHKEYGIKEDKIFDDEMLDKLRNILITIGRVLISSDNTPEFFALISSDIKMGIDYTIIGNILDMKKFYGEAIPPTEANRRYVIKFKVSPESINDTTGFHFLPYDIKMTDFLADQIAQRIGTQFQEDDFKKCFRVDKSDGRFADGVFYIQYSIIETAKPKHKVNIRKEMLKTAAYCLRAYEFNDYTGIALTDIEKQERVDYDKKEMQEIIKRL